MERRGYPDPVNYQSTTRLASTRLDVRYVRADFNAAVPLDDPIYKKNQDNADIHTRKWKIRQLLENPDSSRA
eukprot:1541843-Pyramimonas_sp.AAC.1